MCTADSQMIAVQIVKQSVIWGVNGALLYAMWGCPRFCTVKRTITSGQDAIHTSTSDPYPETYTFTKDTETGEDCVVITLRGGGHSGPEGRSSKMTPALHLHVNDNESFKVLEGKMALDLNGQCSTVTKDDPRFTVPPMVPHTFWKSPDSETQVSVAVTLGSHIPSSRSFFENLVGLQRDYNYNAPLLGLFVLLDAHEIYPGDVPFVLSKLIVSCGAWLGRLLGHRAEYPEYTTPYSEKGKIDRERTVSCVNCKTD